MKTTLIQALAATTLLFGGLGCGSEKSDDASDAGVAECEHDSDCWELYRDERAYCDYGDELDPTDDRCVSCLATTFRGGRVADTGCGPGEECVEGACRSAVTCDPGADVTGCPVNAPFCVLGTCVQCVEDGDCPFHGEDDCLDVDCAAGACETTEVCRCNENADCDDGDDCTTDICTVDESCRYASYDECSPDDSDDGDNDSDNDGDGDDNDSDDNDSDDDGDDLGDTADAGDGDESVTFRWTKPGAGDFDRAVFSAAVDGGPMVERCDDEDARSITCTLTGLNAGDRVDVSVEYEDGNTTSWSCTGSGTSGSPRGVLEGTDPDIDPDEFDPVSNGVGGCNLRLAEVPNS